MSLRNAISLTSAARLLSLENAATSGTLLRRSRADRACWKPVSFNCRCKDVNLSAGVRATEHFADVGIQLALDNVLLIFVRLTVAKQINPCDHPVMVGDNGQAAVCQ